MQAELAVRAVLDGSNSVKEKVERIGEFMSWDKEGLKKAIETHGTATSEVRGKIIKTFWGKNGR